MCVDLEFLRWSFMVVNVGYLGWIFVIEAWDEWSVHVNGEVCLRMTVRVGSRWEFVTRGAYYSFEVVRRVLRLSGGGF